mmetsp:Transcript_26509/g.44807  ORF Transcript_26509/g.44807 Transcript_26509/m.44807 type:complete len:539 (+) Transcript_26509:89-1705(+)
MCCSKDGHAEEGSSSYPLRTQVSMAWSRRLLLAVFCSSSHGEFTRGERWPMTGNGDREERTSHSLPCVILRAVLTLLRRAQQSCSAVQFEAISSLQFSLLCRDLLLASISLLLTLSSTIPLNTAMRRIANAAHELKHAVLALLRSEPGRCAASATVLELALPLPEILHFSADGDIMTTQNRWHESIAHLLDDFRRADDSSCRCYGPQSADSDPILLTSGNIDALNILKHHFPSSSIKNEFSTVPAPVYQEEHFIGQLIKVLLTSNSMLVRYLCRCCAQLESIRVNNLSKKRHLGPTTVHETGRMCPARVNPVLNALLLSISSLQHLLPIVYCSRMSVTVAVILDHAVTMSKLFAKLSTSCDDRSGAKVCDSKGLAASCCQNGLALLRHQLLLATCDLITASTLCNGLVSHDESFNKCREAFLLLFNGLGSACSSPSQDRRESQEEWDGQLSTPSVCLEAVMWSILLQTSINFGEKVRIYNKLKSRVATLVPKNMIHLIQARAGGCTAPLQLQSPSGPSSSQRLRKSKDRVVAALSHGA